MHLLHFSAFSALSCPVNEENVQLKIFSSFPEVEDVEINSIASWLIQQEISHPPGVSL